MSENKIKGASDFFAICDVQREYSEHLFQLLAEKFEGKYQFHLFHDVQKITEFFEKNSAEILLIGEEYSSEITEKISAGIKFVLTGIPGGKEDSETIPLFRYQPAEAMIAIIQKYEKNKREDKQGYRAGKLEMSQGSRTAQRREREHVCERRESVRIRDDPPVRGLIGIYSPIHRIGKTKFALRLGQKMSCRVPVLYLNLEGYSGGEYYFQEGADKDLGDLLYFLKQERDDWGLKLAAMATRKKGMDYIFPMRNEQDLRSVRGEEWIQLLDMILAKCIYEVIILDLGDAVCGLYDILRKCDRIYTPYICESTAKAKLKQYEENLRTSGYTDILLKTVKKHAGKGNRYPQRSEGKDDKSGIAV